MQSTVLILAAQQLRSAVRHVPFDVRDINLGVSCKFCIVLDVGSASVYHKGLCSEYQWRGNCSVLPGYFVRDNHGGATYRCFVAIVPGGMCAVVYLVLNC